MDPSEEQDGDLATILKEKQAEGEALARLADLSIAQVVRAGHEAMLRFLVAKVTAGTIKHQEMAILRNMLRDNGMILDFPALDVTPQKQAALPPIDDLPQLERPDYE